jgi:hypothetical protein
MGREIRRVPPNWEHPRYTEDDARDRRAIGQYKSLYDEDYETAAQEWLANFDLWRAGKHESQSGEYASESKYYWEYDTPPNEESYRPKFTEEPTWYQVYETVSEGSPTTPPFATQDELIDYLVNVGEMAGTQYQRKHSREAATKFVKGSGYAPSMVVERGPSGVTIKEGIEASL